MARPREFEPEEALDAIMGVFWRQGYEGTSLQDIEAATGLNKQSLYRIYADKRAMYLAALQRYDEVEMANAAQMLSEPGSARTRLQRLFKPHWRKRKSPGLSEVAFYAMQALIKPSLTLKPKST